MKDLTMSKVIPITICRSNDPEMIELWSANSLWAVVHEDLFRDYIDLAELIGNNYKRANFELVLKDEESHV